VVSTRTASEGVELRTNGYVRHTLSREYLAGSVSTPSCQRLKMRPLDFLKLVDPTRQYVISVQQTCPVPSF
jgi:hypothetical protein